MSDEQGDVQSHWTVKKRMALVVSILRGDTSVKKTARAHGVPVAEIEDRKDKSRAAGENAVRSRDALRAQLGAAGQQHIAAVSSWRQYAGEMLVLVQQARSRQHRLPADRRSRP